MGLKTKTAWTCHCGSHSRSTWDEEVDPDWSKEELMENTKAGDSAKSHIRRAGGDRCVPIVHYEGEANPYVQEDREVTAIYGTLKGWEWDADAREGSVSIRSLDGRTFEAEVRGVTVAKWMVDKTAPNRNYYVSTDFLTDSEAVLEACTRPAQFRVVNDPSGDWLFATTSLRYKPLSAEDIIEAVNAAFPDADFSVFKQPTGQHGGVLSADLGKYGPMEVSLRVDCGSKDGFESARSYGAGKVLACSNELTLEVSSLVEHVPDARFETKSRHLETPLAQLVNNIANVREAVDRVEEYAEAAKGVKVSEDDARKILAFYEHKGRISARTRDLVLDAFANDELAQVPGTLYGLSMAATWVGTHGTTNTGRELSEGVRESLQRIGGEMLLVSKNFKHYYDIVEANQPPKEEAKAAA